MARYTKTTVSSVSGVNSELDKISTALDDMLDREGATPNQMEVDLDMNSNDILNASTVYTQNLAIDGALVSTSEPVATIQTVTTETATATAGQTLFNLSNEYVAGANTLTVFVNGVKMRLNTDYTETSSSSVTFTSGLSLNDIVEFYIGRYVTDATLYDSDAVTYDPPFTGSTATTVETKLSETVSVKDFGAVGDGVTDDTAAIQAALDNNKSIYIPDGTYKVQDLTVSSQNEIHCQSQDTIIEGVTSSDNIFTTTGAINRIRVSGGRWQNCADVWNHTGNSALAFSEFTNMYIRDCTNGFNLSSSVGNDWVRCNFGTQGAPGNITRGLYFPKTGTGQTNINNIFQCKFFFNSDWAVEFSDNSIVALKNTFDSCWFEDATAGAIYVGGSCRGIKIVNSYFETNDSTSPDILIEQSVGGTITKTEVSNNEFNTAGSSQTERVKTVGNCQVFAENNLVTLASGQNFVAITSSGAFHNELYSNYLNAVGGGTYESRLYTKTASQQVSWSTYVGSGFVTDDDDPKAVEYGVKAQPWFTFSSGDATPSVREGNMFKTSGTTTITDLDDGTDGQQVTIKAGNTITVLGVAMVLDDVAIFANDNGTWLHVNK